MTDQLNNGLSNLWLEPFKGFSTAATHAGQEPEQWNSRMVVPAITPSTTFKQFSPGEHTGYEYSRSGNPTRTCLEKCVAALEGGKHALAFSSGLAATQIVINLLKSGDHVITTDDVYGGTNRYFQKIASKFGLEFSFVDFTNIENVKNAMKPNTKIVWCETPTNPTMKVTDIRKVAEITKQQNDCLLVVDNTFMSSYFQRPLSLGADISMHSATKYMNGHSDVVMGLLIVNDDALRDRLYFLQYATGPTPSAFDCYLVNRGLKTLALRMEKHQENAIAIAKYLEKHPLVEKVKYPGLPSHPQHEIMKKQATGCSGMVSFWMKTDLEQSKNFFKNLKIFILAESLGGYESLAEHPAIMTHASVPPEQRKLLGIGDNFVRLSVGIEDVEDLQADLDQALKAAVAGYK
uniref:cystathionine gamma-lyase-like n=1 Tax=Styela clava TaxID=7725 RepID=UPI00193AA960|nr:cystathionine gamma-lyase-like [Styela clava]